MFISERFYVASTKGRFADHLAIFPVHKSVMDFLLDLQIDRNVRLWDENYHANSFWNSEDPLVSPDLNAVLVKVRPRQEGSLPSLTVTIPRILAAQVGIFHKEVPKSEFVRCLTPMWVIPQYIYRYISRTGDQ